MMKRLAAIAALSVAAACGSDSPTTPTNPNTEPIVFISQLSAANEVPLISNAEANARGALTMTMTIPRNAATGTITGPGKVSFTAQLTGFPNGSMATLAHVHRGGVGIVDGVEVNTGLTAASPVSLPTGAGAIAINDVAITQALAAEIAANPGAFYFDVHTPLSPAGVVRGQLVRQ